MKLRTLCLLTSTLLLSACIAPTRIADLTLVSSKNYNINSKNFVRGERVSGTDVPDKMFAAFKPNLKTAIDRAIEKNRCAVALSDVVISSYGGIEGPYLVEGTLILDRSLDGCEK